MSELQRLRDRVAELEDVLGMTAELPPELFGQLTIQPIRKALLGILLARPFVPRDAAYDALYGMLPEGEQPQLKTIDAHLCILRKTLRPHGIAIQTRWGAGYYMTDADKAKLRALCPDAPA